MSKKILYLTTNHQVYDDRIYYHFKPSFEKVGCHFYVCSTYTKNIDTTRVKSQDGENLSRSEKLEWFYAKIVEIKPDVIFCGEPLPILAAVRYQKKYSIKIIYDVTEWYPSKKHLQGLSFIKKAIKGLLMFALHLYGSFKSDGIIVGEYHKKIIFDRLFSFKPALIVSYFPKKSYISLKEKKIEKDDFVIGYTGKFSKEKGIERVFKVADKLQELHPNKKIKLSLIGKTYNEKQARILNKLIACYENLDVTLTGMVSFEDFKESILKFDFALDLRSIDIENTRCLPIKIFHYCGCGIPVVYSDLKAIKRFFSETGFIHLVHPDDYLSTVKYISSLLEDKDMYVKVSKEAVAYIEKHCTWENVEKKLLNFVEEL